MSKIERELVKATDVESKKGETRQEYLYRLAKAVAKLDDKDWEALSTEAQDWYNTNTNARNKAKNADKDMPDFGEFADAEEEEQPRSRGRASAGEEETKSTKKSTGGPDILKKGQVVEIENKRGKVFKGKVTELDDEVVVLDKDEEIDVDKIVKVTVLEDVAGAKGSSEDDGDPIKVGAVVKVTTKRGKEIEGTIKELDDDEIVLETKDGDEELRRDRVETIKVLGGGKKAAAGKSADKGKDVEEEPVKTRAKNQKGVSVGQRIRELICDDLDAKPEAIGKILKKEGIDFKDNTLDLNYTEVHKTISILRERKMLKA